MTFQTGFAVTQEFSLANWRLENVTGRPLQGSVARLPRSAKKGTMLEIDPQHGRVRLPFGPGVYLATDLTADLKRTIVDLAEYATTVIAAIMKKHDADEVVKAATTWLETGLRCWWTRDIPWQLELLGFAAGHAFRVVRVTDREIFLVSADRPRTYEWAVAIGDIRLCDLGFDAPGMEPVGADRLWLLVS
jgi:hypothetical protein